MRIVKNDEFDPGQICDSGQCFRMRRLGPGDTQTDTYEVLASDRRITIRAYDGCIELDCDDGSYEEFWREYFDMDTDYGSIIRLIDPQDDYLTRAAARGSGIRILKQDTWEMIVSFLISQQNNITRIRRCIDNICNRYGDIHEYADGEYHSFPTPESLSALNDDDLMECNLGYRSKYVVRAARAVADGSLDINALDRMDYESARGYLLDVYGIGAKVADCICLFALHHLEAFPVDTHIRQVLEREYGTGHDDPSKHTYAGGFPFDRYRPYAGVIQQYMFYSELTGTDRH